MGSTLVAVRQDLPPFPEGIAQPVRADASHASGRRRESFCPHHFYFCPCGVAQSTCLPLMQEITGGNPVSDASFFAPKALSAMRSLGKRMSPVQLRVGAPVSQRPQSNQRSGRRHKPAAPGAAPGTATISVSLQQPADFFCKEIWPEHHRREAPVILLA